MRDEDDPGVEAVQMLLEPLDGGRVEVVGGLVQQQEIRLCGQRASERCPGQLAARERPQLAVEVGGGETETACDRLEPRAPGVAAGTVEGPLGGVVAAHHRRVRLASGHAPLELGQLGLEPARIGRTGADVRTEGDVAAEGRALVVQGDPRPCGHRHLAAVGLQLAGQDPEQRRLPGTVSADQCDPVAGSHDRRHVGQDLVRSEGERHGRDVQRHPRIMPAMVGLFATCLGDAVHPQVVRDSERVLRAAGADPSPVRGATCCGQPAWNSGFVADARRVARTTLRAMTGLEAVVVPSGSCAAMIRLHWPQLFRGDRDEAAAKRVAGRAFELSQYLVEELGAAGIGSPLGRAVTYHDSCHMLRELRLPSRRGSSCGLLPS